MIEIKKVDQLLEELKIWGCDIDGAMDRLMYDKEIYMKFLYQFKEEDKFVELERAVLEKDQTNAFESAHTLKGVAGNLSLNPIYDSISKLVEVLKKDDISEVIPLLEDVLEKKKEFCAITDKAGLV